MARSCELSSCVTTDPMDHIRRMGALRRKMTRAGLPGLLITHPPDVRYLSGFTGSSAALAVTRRVARLFTDGRYKAQAAEEVKAVQVEIAQSSPTVAAVQWLAAQPGVTMAGFDPARTTVADLARWKHELPSRLRRSLFQAIPAPFVEILRCVKDEDELALMAEAAFIGCKLFEHILGVLRPGLPEIEAAAELEHQARILGAEGMSFETIVASGERSAMPHGRATTTPLPRRGFVTLDFGIILKGYCSDMTRTVFLGTPRPRERSVYLAVLEAQEAAVDAVAPGVSCAEVDEAARSILRREGLAEAFSHSAGHGVGLEIHEPPRVGAGQRTRLQPGMLITIEPGVYLAGAFGVRIEDMVTVTRSGGQVLTPAPKALIEL
ncbi:Peptidase, M24 family [Candidatus Sulfotelmatomonas gaucii]|uniref:Peptidase, M24 family n=1 Tax=Candidatus Sulfuritelmatomonas gaucii TaxID=2043161 RepID=A0A2N9LTZ1_9BACT|nr:Peptidase, M24 family [Candidatus Sulfotelmatomonas gaucii]